MKKGRPRVHDREKIAHQVKELLRQGNTLETASELIGLHRVTAGKICKDYGIDVVAVRMSAATNKNATDQNIETIRRLSAKYVARFRSRLRCAGLPFNEEDVSEFLNYTSAVALKNYNPLNPGGAKFSTYLSSAFEREYLNYAHERAMSMREATGMPIEGCATKNDAHGEGDAIYIYPGENRLAEADAAIERRASFDAEHAQNGSDMTCKYKRLKRMYRIQVCCGCNTVFSTQFIKYPYAIDGVVTSCPFCGGTSFRSFKEAARERYERTRLSMIPKKSVISTGLIAA